VRSYLAFGACTLIWGSTFVAIRSANDVTAPVWGATVRLALAAVLLYLLTRVTRAPLPTGAALRGAALFGLANFGVNFTLLYIGETHVPSGIAAVIYASIPLTTSLMAAASGLERLDRGRLGAAVLGLIGVGIIFAAELARDVPILSLLFVLVAATAAALSAIFLKRAPVQDPIAANAVATAVGCIFCLGASVLLQEDRTLPGSLLAWLPLTYLAIAGSTAFVLYSWLLRRWSATDASFMSVLIPVIALGLGALIKGEQLPPASFIGAVLVIAAVASVLIAGAREAAAAPRARGGAAAH